ncbi:MAG: TlpA disulfide reductase family protein [Acidobacteriota bacterium]
MAVLEPGRTFPTLSLRDADGGPAVLPRGQILWGFFKTTCPTCELMWPFLDRLSSMAQRAGTAVVAVSQDDRGETEAFYERLRIDPPTLYDPPPWNASEAVGLSNVPTLFLVSAEARIRETVEGFQKAKMEELAARFSAESRSGAPAGQSRILSARSRVTSESFFRPGESVPALRPG